LEQLDEERCWDLLFWDVELGASSMNTVRPMLVMSFLGRREDPAGLKVA
jgi:hypothetical protein